MHVKPYGVIFACVADGKGPTPNMVRTVADWIKRCGLVKFRYRSDKEKSLVRLLEDAIRESGRDGEPLTDEELERDREQDRLLEPCGEPAPRSAISAIPEHSGVGESQSNGAVENGCTDGNGPTHYTEMRSR